MTKQRGFTLIELIIVIIILGILAVTAAPRFFNFADDARAATVNGVVASMQSASELINAKALIGVQEATATEAAQEGITAGDDIVSVDADTWAKVNGRFAAPEVGGIISALNLDRQWAVHVGTDRVRVYPVSTITVPEDPDLTVSGAIILTSAPTVNCYAEYAQTGTARPTINGVTTNCG